MLRLECEVGERASYALDAEHQRHEWSGPVHVGAETVLAFCGEELNMLARPVRPHPYPALSPSPSLPSPKPSPSPNSSPSLSPTLDRYGSRLTLALALTLALSRCGSTTWLTERGATRSRRRRGGRAAAAATAAAAAAAAVRPPSVCLACWC